MRFFYWLLPVACLLVINTCAARKPDAAATIRGILKAQETAWNKGDLRSFMKGYWESDSMLFLGKKGPTYGYRATLANYLKGYPDTAHMGHFTSTVLKLQALGRRYYMVVGRWELQRSIGDVGGYYSLLFRRIRGHWVIIQDHTS